MPQVEIDEVELLRLRKQDQTVHTLLANPKAKKKVFEAYKAQWPDAKIPELELEDEARKPLTELQEKFDKLAKKVDDDEAERQKQAKLAAIGGGVEAGKTKLRQAGWTDEGIAEVEKVMTERGIIDVEVAAAFYEKQHPPQVPATPRGQGGWNFVENVNESEADLKKMLDSKGQSDVLADKMARDALNDFRGATRR